MEEKELKPATAAEGVKEEEKMIPVSQANQQVQTIIKQATSKIQELSTQMQQLELMLRDKTTDHLFKVLEYSQHFDDEFVSQCTEVIKDYLVHVAFPKEDNQEEVKE